MGTRCAIIGDRHRALSEAAARMLTSHIGCLHQVMLLLAVQGFVTHLAGNSQWSKYLGIHHPCRRPKCSSWLLALAWPNQSCDRNLGSKPEDGRFILSFILSLSSSSPSSPIFLPHSFSSPSSASPSITVTLPFKSVNQLKITMISHLDHCNHFPAGFHIQYHMDTRLNP